MRLLRRGVPIAGLVSTLVALMVLAVPAEALALVPVPEYVTFIHSGALEQMLAGDDRATVLVDPTTLPTDSMFMVPPLEVVGHQWSPDGTHLVVSAQSTATGFKRLYVCDHNGQNPVQVMIDGRTTVTWAPDGSRLAAVRYEDQSPDGQLYLVELDGSSTMVGMGVDPAWSPDCSRIAYAQLPASFSSMGSSAPSVMVHTLGEDSVEIARGDAPSFSPDGDEVLYRAWSDPDDSNSSRQLAIAPAGGGESRLLTDYGPMDDSGGPAQIVAHRWSPDGAKVYYLFGRRSDSQWVYEVAADGSYAEPVQVSGLATEYVLSLDGTRLVYTSGEVSEASFQTRQQVYARDLASCAEWQLTTEELADFTCSNLSVSNQDRYVAFEAALVPTGGVPADATTREVWVATLDGSHAWRCATDAWDVTSQPAYGTSARADDGVTDDDLGPMDDDYDPTRRGFFQTIRDAIGAFFGWLAGLFD